MMDILKLESILNKFYNNQINLDSKEIISFTMDREYFLDVFETRYEISKDMNKPIKGLKETLYLFKKSSCDKICSTSIKDSYIDITVYTDINFDVFFGIIE